MRALACLLAGVWTLAAEAPVRALLVTGGHDYDPSIYAVFEGAQGIRTTVDPHPMPYARGDLRRRYDVLVLYDSMQEIDERGKKVLTDFLESGKGLVIVHHALVDYSDWQWWYEEVVGARWIKAQSRPLKWKTTWQHDVDIAARVVKRHPVTDGVNDFEINDETYKGMWFSPKVTVLVRTDHPTSDGPLVWISPYEKSRVVSIELGHGRPAHLNPHFQRLVRNAILWAGGKK